MTELLYFTSLLHASRKTTSRSREVAFDLRGRYWDRTSDLFGVKEPTWFHGLSDEAD
ncbi:hypothetical protein ACIBPB_32875 [Micromonospora sp. NPDC049836]|uniref:hypothetical protein n=1 Tax=Micromonospora sp. NPDC049836 TaxID=3364274 RepID=UPI0037B51C4A